MTLCDYCHSAPATVHITQIAHHKTIVSHLCETCAREQGVVVEVGRDGIVPEVQVQADAQAGPAEKEKDRECGFCHLTLSEFKAQGRLGCPQCYKEFDREIEALLVKVHGSAVHRGKGHVAAGDAGTAGDLTRLQRELSEAVAREEFELAAQLRDGIDRLKEDSHGGAESTEKIKNK
ncbi:MAG TPA: UvrB/UvrC motif-containing protein [Chitinivibrionales bacterium]|nr:UvrB/UvrC motif-containing protein [Chitinivibrionales bacterium]